MVHIKFTLEDCEIAYECTDMDERLKKKLWRGFKINDSFCINSINYPEIKRDSLSIRGDNTDMDNHKSYLLFNDNDERDVYLSKVKHAFKELKVYLKEQYPDDYTEPTFTVINDSEKSIDNTKDGYEYLTAESLKEILNSREEYITNTIIKTIDGAIRERMLQGYDQFCMSSEDFKVSIENKEIQNKVIEHFSNIGIDIEWDVKTMSLPICNVKVVK